MREYRQSPMYNLWLTLFDQFTYSLPVLVFTSLFSPAAAAHFALANSILRLPGSLVGQSVAQVFYERAARRKEAPVALRRFVVGNVRALALLIAVPAIVIMLFGPQLFSLIFGEAWTDAGTYARLLMVAIAFTFVTSPISLAPTVLNQQHVHLALAMLTFAARIITIFVGAQSGSSVLTVALFSLGEAVTLALFLGWLLFYLRRLEQRRIVQVG
jgi:O-antigen/teichoic acid export membrane protein